jgi:MazG family protein
MDELSELVEMVDRLRAEGGCAWDRAQTPMSLRPYLIEEAHEAAAAIGLATPEQARDELGDLLFVAISIARAYQEAGAFTLTEVAQAAAAKMRRRHPHVFGDAVARPGDWQRLKAAERPAGAGLLDGVPRSLPPLLRAHRVSARAASVGFDWPDRAGVQAKVHEELAELDEALAEGEPEHITEELGDLLFSLVNLGRFSPTPAHDALTAATDKFERRFRHVERACEAAGSSVLATDPTTLDQLWRSAKEAAC